MTGSLITNNRDHIQSIVSILKQLIACIKSEITANSTSRDIVRIIDKFNRKHNLLDYDKTVFNPEHDEIIGQEILKTYDAINTNDNFFSTILQVCDCNNLNLLEHLWSAILLVGHIVDKMTNDTMSINFSLRDFNYFIFLNVEHDENNEVLGLLNDLMKLVRYDSRIEFIPLLSDDSFDDTLYEYRLLKKLEKIDLLLLLDNNDSTNLRHLKIVETLGLVQPLSFIISTSENLAYSRYVGYTPCEKNKLLQKSSSGNKHPGRWNLVYDTKCVKAGCYQGINIEMTRCVEYLDG